MRPFAELAGSTRVKPSAVTVLLLPGRQYEPITANDWGDPGGGAAVGLVLVGQLYRAHGALVAVTWQLPVSGHGSITLGVGVRVLVVDHPALLQRPAASSIATIWLTGFPISLAKSPLGASTHLPSS